MRQEETIVAPYRARSSRVTPTTIDKSDGCDMSDDKSAGLSGRQRATAVLSDIDAAHEELRIRGEMAAQSPARLHQGA